MKELEKKNPMPVTENLDKMDQFLRKPKLPKLSQEEIANLIVLHLLNKIFVSLFWFWLKLFKH